MSPRAPDPAELQVRAAAAAAPDADALAAAARTCTACPELVATRTHVVVGAAAPGARLLVLGEAPGAQEDESGLPFVGRSGQLLDRLLAEAGGSRDDVAVLNTLKCRPPGNRPPTPRETAHCRGWTERQLELVDPALVVTLGLSATRWFLGPHRARPGARPGARGPRPPGAADLPPQRRDPARAGGGAAAAAARGPRAGAGAVGVRRVGPSLLVAPDEVATADPGDALDLRTVAAYPVPGFVPVAGDEQARALPQALPDVAATEALGERVGGLLRVGDLVVLSGPLGAGKTALTRGLGRALGVSGAVTSPTFVLARRHRGPLPLLHVDAYRLRGAGGGAEVLEDLDLDGALEEGVVVVEWGEGLVEGFAEARLEVELDRGRPAAHGPRPRVRDRAGAWQDGTNPDRRDGMRTLVRNRACAWGSLVAPSP